MQGLPPGAFHPGQAASPSKRKGPKPPRAEGTLPHPIWYILPSSVADTPHVHFTLRSIAKTLPEATATIQRLAATQEAQVGWFGFSPELIASCQRLIHANARVRHACRTLLKCWLLRTRVKAMNEEDVVTLEPPSQPVYVYDWPGRKRFVYEASTIARDFRECLLQRDYMFPAAISPRNLLTNEALTPMQCQSVLYQLRATRKRLHWTLAAFEEGSFSLPRFTRRFESPLRYEVLQSLFAQPTLEDTRSIVFDYIADEHEFREKPFSKAMYAWALQHAPEATRIQRWHRLAHRHHELAIEIVDELERIHAQEKEMDACAEELCSAPHELIALRSEWKRKQLSR